MTAIIVVLLFSASMAGIAWAIHAVKPDDLPHSRSQALKRILEKEEK
jgi:hypothetical protein